MNSDPVGDLIRVGAGPLGKIDRRTPYRWTLTEASREVRLPLSPL
jgi:hypothetical protein